MTVNFMKVVRTRNDLLVPKIEINPVVKSARDSVTFQHAAVKTQEVSCVRAPFRHFQVTHVWVNTLPTI